jgi:tRNA(Leu) C34 or U34 (ribose-2'-O)-methylase TrmL
MLGTKHSLNVATAGGVTLYELLRKYRRLSEAAGIPGTFGFALP